MLLASSTLYGVAAIIVAVGVAASLFVLALGWAMRHVPTEGDKPDE